MRLAIPRLRRGQAGLAGASLLTAAVLSGCGAQRWAVVNITDDQATILRTDDVRRDGSRVIFTAAVLEHAPRVLDGRLADYWTQRAVVDCAAQTYQLSVTTAFRADGRQIDVDSSSDPVAALRPHSIEATEASYTCGDRYVGLPLAKPGGLISLLQQFRTGTVLRTRQMGGSPPSSPHGGFDV